MLTYLILSRFSGTFCDPSWFNTVAASVPLFFPAIFLSWLGVSSTRLISDFCVMWSDRFSCISRLDASDISRHRFSFFSVAGYMLGYPFFVPSTLKFTLNFDLVSAGNSRFVCCVTATSGWHEHGRLPDIRDVLRGRDFELDEQLPQRRHARSCAHPRRRRVG